MCDLGSATIDGSTCGLILGLGAIVVSLFLGMKAKARKKLISVPIFLSGAYAKSFLPINRI